MAEILATPPSRCLASAPATLAPPSPTPFGRYQGPIADPSLPCWDALRWGRRRLQRKAWFYVGCYTPECIVGFAIVDAGYAATAFAYVYDFASHQYLEEKALVPFGFPNRFAPSLESVWRLERFGRLWELAPSDRGFTLRFQGKSFQLTGEVDHAFPGLSAVAPAHGRPFNHTYKLAAAPGALRITTDGRTATVEGPVFGLDFTAGYPPRHTFWNWAAVAMRGDSGASFGINLVSPFNAGLENALWHDGKLIALPEARFVYDRKDRHAPWHVTTSDERLQLRFAPAGERGETIHLGLLKSRFRQPYGTVSGSYCHADGRVERLIGAGVVEEHEALW